MQELNNTSRTFSPWAERHCYAVCTSSPKASPTILLAYCATSLFCGYKSSGLKILLEFWVGSFSASPQKREDVLLSLVVGYKHSMLQTLHAKILTFQDINFSGSPKKIKEVLLAGNSSGLQPSLLASPLSFWGSWQGTLQMVITWYRATNHKYKQVPILLSRSWGHCNNHNFGHES